MVFSPDWKFAAEGLRILPASRPITIEVPEVAKALVPMATESFNLLLSDVGSTRACVPTAMLRALIVLVTAFTTVAPEPMARESLVSAFAPYPIAVALLISSVPPAIAFLPTAMESLPVALACSPVGMAVVPAAKSSDMAIRLSAAVCVAA